MLKIYRRPNEQSAEVDVSGYTVGQLDEWIALLVTELRASRAAGISCSGRVRVSPDIAALIYPPTAYFQWFEGDSPLMPFAQCDASNDRLEFVRDLSLPPETAIVE